MAEILFDDDDEDDLWIEDPYDDAVSTTSPTCTGMNRLQFSSVS